MADLDRELSNRLSRLADAVPMPSARLEPVHRRAVEARQRVRMAWLTPLVLVVVAVVVGSVLGIGPFAPSGTSDGPVSTTTRSGDFELTIRSSRSRYAAGEPINISASLAYHGRAESIEIGHDIGKDGSPIGFGVIEPIMAGYQLSGGVSRLMCHRSTITAVEPIRQPFSKSGSGYGGDGAAFIAYMHDPLFWLNQGTWHPYAIAWFSTASGPLGTCGAEVKLQAQIEIVVGPAASDETRGERWKSSSVSGDFELKLAAAKATFSDGEPLDVVASLVYLGPEAHTVISHLTWGPIEFGMWAPGITLNPRGRWTCSDIEMTRGVPIVEALGDLGNGGKTFSGPHGVHEITATAEFRRGSCAAPMDSIATSIVVAVSDGPDDIPLLTDVARQVQVCLLVRGGGRLVTSDTGLSVVLFDGTLRDVVWPTGYTARRTPKGAALIGRDGHEIAHEGDQVEFDASSAGEKPLWPCGDVSASPSTGAG